MDQITRLKNQLVRRRREATTNQYHCFHCQSTTTAFAKPVGIIISLQHSGIDETIKARGNLIVRLELKTLIPAGSTIRNKTASTPISISRNESCYLYHIVLKDGTSCARAATASDSAAAAEGWQEETVSERQQE